MGFFNKKRNYLERFIKIAEHHPTMDIVTSELIRVYENTPIPYDTYRDGKILTIDEFVHYLCKFIDDESQMTPKLHVVAQKALDYEHDVRRNTDKYYRPIENFVHYNTSYLLKKFNKFKQVYTFDKNLAIALSKTTIDGFHPAALLDLPFSSFYIDIPNLDVGNGKDLDNFRCLIDAKVVGAFCNVNHVLITGHPELPGFIEIGINIIGRYGKDVLDAWPSFMTFDLNENSGRKNFELHWGHKYGDDPDHDFIPLLLYIAAHNADVVGSQGEYRKYVKHAKPSSKITKWNVGTRIGPKIEKMHRIQEGKCEYHPQGNHNSPRPHVRAAHWHHFWVGPRDGERKLIVKWVMETFVNCKDAEELPNVVRESRHKSN